MTLERYAFTVAGPRDFFINLVINTVVPWWVLRGREAVPLLGNPSALTLLGPMGFLLVSITTFFGFLNGVKQRKAGQIRPPLARETSWIGVAARTSLRHGILACAAFVLAILGLARLFPAAQLPSALFILFQGTFAACFAYVVQVNAVLQTRKL